MAQHNQLDERNMDNVFAAQDVLYVYDGRRAINDLVAKL